ncbi:biotin--[acetyl-CoA-carboxylase] ligase [Vulcanococcus sp.]|uniref:biotin--[acetyl-CoA-carboxylase] ligase n=1 Tax=Vulcanococcus sp. TaxID=2856995 RepID=UPI003C0DD004
MVEQPLTAAALAAQLRLQPREYPLPWRLRAKAVCGSTERELERWLQSEPELQAARLVVAQRQRHGHGQQGRVWVSPAGGVWLSALLPWPQQPQASASLALAASLGLVLQLEALGLKPQIKWPNDVLIDQKKLAGLLPRLRWRAGQVRCAQVGLGLNGRNPGPEGSISLREALAGREPATLRHDRLVARVVAGLEWAVAAAPHPELVRRQAEQRLWRPESLEHEGQPWSIEGLELDGGLRIRRGTALAVLQRRF